MIKADALSKSDFKRINRTFRKLPKEVKADVRKHFKSEVGPIWTESVAESISGGGASAKQAQVFGKGNRVRAGAVTTLVAGASTKQLSGGARIVELARPYNFGTTNQEKYTRYYRTSKGGKRHTVTRRTRAHIPAKRRDGYVSGPALNKAIPRMAKLTTQTMMRKIYRAAEGRK